MSEWPPAQRARDILLIGHNLNVIWRQWRFFEEKLRTGCQVRCLVVDPRNEGLIEILSRGVVEHTSTAPDFQAPLRTMKSLLDSLSQAEKSLLKIKTTNYVPTLSFQILDGEDSSCGTILVELTPNRIEVSMRPHFVLSAENQADRAWYQIFLKNCCDMYGEGQDWTWE